jgi:demethylspheroidene O-methyltransferase
MATSLPRAAGSGPSILDSWRSFRDRLLASARFQRWAAGFPLTRPIAQKRTRALFDLCAGFVYTQVLTSCVRLNLFEILAERPQSLDALALRLHLSPDVVERLLLAAISLELVERRGEGRFGLGALGAAMIGNPAVAKMVEHHALLYRDLTDPVALLRGDHPPTELARYWGYAGTESPTTLSDSQVASYSGLMSASQPFVAEDVLDAYRLGRHRCVMDVGGGEGTFLRAVGTRLPDIRLMLFDLPAVAARAQQFFARDGLSARASATGGDFFQDPLPVGADLVTLLRVVHDHDDARVLTLLTAVRRVLPPDGALLLAEPMAGTPGAEPMADAYFGFYLLAMGRGRARTAEELTALLTRSGFDRVQLLPARRPLLTRLILARPCATSQNC